MPKPASTVTLPVAASPALPNSTEPLALATRFDPGAIVRPPESCTAAVPCATKPPASITAPLSMNDPTTCSVPSSVSVVVPATVFGPLACQTEWASTVIWPKPVNWVPRPEITPMEAPFASSSVLLSVLTPPP